MAAGQHFLTSDSRQLGALSVGADAIEDGRFEAVLSAAEPADSEGRRDNDGSRRWLGPPAVSELDHGFERVGVGQGHDPEKLDPAAAFVKVNLDGVLFLLEHLPLVMLGSPVQVQESVTIGAKVSATVADDDGRSLSVVVIFASRTRIRTLASVASCSGPLARGQPFDVVLVEDAERGQGKPQDRKLEALVRIPELFFQLGQVENVLSDGGLGDDGPVFAQLSDRHVFEKLDDVFRDLLGHGASHPPAGTGRVSRMNG